MNHTIQKGQMKRRRGEEEEEEEWMVQQEGDNKYGDGVAWYRGAMLGKGSFGSVYLATLKKPRSKYSCLPSIMAVKSAEVSVSASIQKEREVLSNVKGCPGIIRCFGEETTTGENGMMVYNILLEYGSGGTLADRIKKSGSKGLPEFEVRSYTKSILEGLKFIHEIGYVHCDLKPQNILLVRNADGASTEFRAKIADFGLTKREKQCKKRKLEAYWRGTPMYLSPEVVMENVQKQQSDIWALGCIVLEMLTGKPPWDPNQELSDDDILKKIGEGMELPTIPSDLSKEAKDFLKGCFVRKSMYRLTAEMLLHQSFMEGVIDDNDRYADVEEIEDVNGIESILLVSEDDWSYASEDDSFNYYSEEEAEEFEFEDDYEDDFVSEFSEDEQLSAEESRDVMSPKLGPGYDITVQASVGVPSQVPLKNTQQCRVNITIPAGV